VYRVIARFRSWHPEPPEEDDDSQGEYRCRERFLDVTLLCCFARGCATPQGQHGQLLAAALRPWLPDTDPLPPAASLAAT
jgi:hypothetical protein